MFVVAVTCSAIDSAQFTVTNQREKQLSWCWHGIREQWQAGTSDRDSEPGANCLLALLFSLYFFMQHKLGRMYNRSG